MARTIGAVRNKSGTSVARVSPTRGTAYETVDYNGETGALSGNPFGSTRVEYGVDLDGGFSPQAIVEEGVPEGVDFELIYDLVSEKFLNDYVGNFYPEKLTTGVLPANVVIDYGIAGELNERTAWEICEVLIGCLRTGIGLDSPSVEPTENTNVKLRQSVSLSALQWIRLKKPTLTKLSATQLTNLNDLPARRIIGTTDNIFWAVVDGDATPTSAQLCWGNASTGVVDNTVSITPMTNTAVTDAVITGGYIVVGNGANVYYSKLSNQLAGTNTWGTATGSVAAVSLGVSPDGRVWAGSSAGDVYRSTDKSPFAFEVFDNGVATSESINSIVFPTSSLGWFGCDAGELLRYDSGALTAVTISGLSDNINKVNVPPKTPSELYLGTAGGDVYHSNTALETVPTFTTLTLPGAISGTGSVVDIQFANTFGGIPAFFLWNPSSGAGRIIHDRSGGALGFDSFAVTETGTANVGLTSMAVINANLVMVCGSAVGSKGYIGRAIAT